MARKEAIVNWKMLLRVVGWLLLIEGAFMSFPLVTTLLYREDYMPFLCGMILTLVCGLLATAGVKPTRFDMGKREGFLLTALVWVVFSFFGMIPFMMCDSPLNVSDAFFEAMSGFTTTGATTMLDTEAISHGIHLWRSLMQWIGGMGIILFTLAVLPMLNSSGGMQMFNAEVTGITHEKLRPRVSATAKRLWLVYLLLTILLCILYWFGPMDAFDSLCHSLSTMSTGGFSTKAESLQAWDSLYVKVVTTVFMFVGGINFALIFRASTGQFKAVWNNEVFKLYVWVIVVMFVVFDIAIFLNPDVPNTIGSLTIDPLFQIGVDFVVDRLHGRELRWLGLIPFGGCYYHDVCRGVCRFHGGWREARPGCVALEKFPQRALQVYLSQPYPLGGCQPQRRSSGDYKQGDGLPKPLYWCHNCGRCIVDGMWRVSWRRLFFGIRMRQQLGT